MIKEAIEKILSLGLPNLKTIGETTFSDKEMKAVIEPTFHPDTLKTNTLDSIVQYAQGGIETIEEDEEVFIHVVSHRDVILYSHHVGTKKQRAVFVHADLSLFPEGQFGKWMSQEQFMINSQTSFVESAELARLQALAGSVRNESSNSGNDDGITQKVMTAKGVHVGKPEEIKNPFTLAPFRTFREVQQPESLFIFRVKGKEGQQTEFALFEADGQEWKLRAINAIAEYLRDNLGNDFKIIS